MNELSLTSVTELTSQELSLITGGQDEVTKGVVYYWEYFWSYVAHYPNAAAERASKKPTMSNAYLNSMGMH